VNSAVALVDAHGNVFNVIVMPPNVTAMTHSIAAHAFVLPHPSPIHSGWTFDGTAFHPPAADLTPFVRVLGTKTVTVTPTLAASIPASTFKSIPVTLPTAV
jgi:hypothetical protein